MIDLRLLYVKKKRDRNPLFSRIIQSVRENLSKEREIKNIPHAQGSAGYLSGFLEQLFTGEDHHMFPVGLHEGFDHLLGPILGFDLFQRDG